MKKILLHNMTFRGIHVVPGVMNYDQRSLVFAEKEDIVITNSPVDRAYLKYLENLKFPIKEIEFLFPTKNSNPTWNSIFNLPQINSRLESIKNNKDYVIDVYIPSEFDGKLSDKFGIKHCNNYRLSQLYGTKSGFRKFAKAARLPIAEGFENLEKSTDVMDALRKIFKKGFQKAVVKVDDGISGYGNIIFTSHEYSKIKTLAAKDFFNNYLKKIRWNIVSSGVVEGWIENVVNSSSILIFIDKNITKIVCFQDQLLIDGDKWAGCYFPSSLNKNIFKKINRIVERSAKYLRKKGFWGYYSFDLVTTADNKVYCVEANMRKIGSFYPRVFVDRIKKNFTLTRNYSYVSSDYVNPKIWKGKSFREIHNRLKKLLWPIENTHEGVLIFNTGAIKDGGRFDFISIAATLKRAKSLREEVIRLAS